MARSKYEFVSWSNYIYLTLLRWWASISARFFFRKFRSVGTDNIPLDVPVLFCANHQSAFLDPVLIAVTCGRKPWYVTRAGVFTNKIVRFLLNSLHMLPIFRPRDNVNIKEANVDTFAYCENILGGNGSVVIFVEGNHDMRNRLRVPLKKGFARMALSASTSESPVWIVPVGLTYEDPIHPRSDMLIQYGKAFSVNPFLDTFNQNEAEGLNILTRELESQLRPLVLDIADAQRYDEIERSWQECRDPAKNLQARFRDDQSLIGSLSEGADARPAKTGTGGISRLILQVFAFPIVILGVVLNLPLILVTNYILKKAVRDPHFDQSIKFVCGMAGVPLFGLLFFITLYLITGEVWPSLVTAGISPFLGLIAYDLYAGLFRNNKYVPSVERMKFRR